MTSAQHPDRDHRSGLDAQTLHDPLALSELIATGDIDVVPGDPPVPIAVWRVAAVDGPYGHNDPNALTPRMAAMLVGSYTQPGDTIVSVGDDPALAGAAGAGGRTYLPVRDLDNLSGLHHAAGTIRLIILPWPPANRPSPISRENLVEMFDICRRLMTRDGCTIVALATLSEGDTYAEHGTALIPAARHAGLGWLQHIIAITAPISGQSITWRTTPTAPATLRTATHIKIHLDLFVFMTRVGRHG